MKKFTKVARSWRTVYFTQTCGLLRVRPFWSQAHESTPHPLPTLWSRLLSKSRIGMQAHRLHHEASRPSRPLEAVPSDRLKRRKS